MEVSFWEWGQSMDWLSMTGKIQNWSVALKSSPNMWDNNREGLFTSCNMSCLYIFCNFIWHDLCIICPDLLVRFWWTGVHRYRRVLLHPSLYGRKSSCFTREQWRSDRGRYWRCLWGWCKYKMLDYIFFNQTHANSFFIANYCTVVDTVVSHLNHLCVMS